MDAKKKSTHKRDNNLIISLDKDFNIIKFNNQSEKTTGYLFKDIKKTPFFKNLISKKYENQWKNILESAQKDSKIDEFKLPILTKNGYELMFIWNSFPIKNKDGIVQDISLVGEFIDTWEDNNEDIILGWEEVKKPDLSKDFEYGEIEKLQIKNQYLIDENNYLKKNLKKYIDIFSSQNTDNKDYVSSGIYRLNKIVASKKRKEELEAYVRELNDREKYLNDLEERFLEEKKGFNKQRIELINWRNRLEEIESEIESRKKWVDSKEKSIAVVNERKKKKEKIENSGEYDSIIKDMSESAVVIQRGILKEANESFAGLLGYDISEILEKSIFDFIAPESFDIVEDFYKRRLKGEEINNYSTVLLSKDNEKINVTIKTRPTLLNGDIAEIALIKKE